VLGTTLNAHNYSADKIRRALLATKQCIKVHTRTGTDIKLCTVSYVCVSCRFVNELSTRSVVTAAIFEHGKKLTADDDTAEGKPVVTEVNENAPKDPVVAYLIMNG
jgi:hypothetical protein